MADFFEVMPEKKTQPKKSEGGFSSFVSSNSTLILSIVIIILIVVIFFILLYYTTPQQPEETPQNKKTRHEDLKETVSKDELNKYSGSKEEEDEPKIGIKPIDSPPKKQHKKPKIESEDEGQQSDLDDIDL
jgi:cytoskeletal protein RodZ